MSELPVKSKVKLVLDANAFIKHQNLINFANSVDFYLPYSISQEIRDKNARAMLETFPFELITVNPSTDSYDFAKEFARLTGDLGVLSEQDLDFIALAYELAVENGKGSLIRKTPSNFVSSMVKNISLVSVTTGSQPIEEEKKEKEVDSEDSDGFMEVVDKKKEKTNAKSKENKEVENEEKAENEIENEEIDDSSSDDGTNWITPSISKGISDENEQKFLLQDNNNIGVAALSSDFAIQNVIQQLGIPLITLDGKRIKHVKKWVKFCYTCQSVVVDVEKVFCPECGNDTLTRLSCSVDDDGKIKCFFKRGYKVNTRGNIYPIPKPKGGKHNHDLILSEDELKLGGRDRLLRGERKHREKEFKDAVSNIENHFEIDPKHKKKFRNFDIGYGKINPNDRHEFAKRKYRFK